MKLVPKATAIEMAMKLKGLFAAEKHDHNVVVLDFDKLYEATNNGQKEIDPIEAKILALEGTVEPSNND